MTDPSDYDPRLALIRDKRAEAIETAPMPGSYEAQQRGCTCALTRRHPAFWVDKEGRKWAAEPTCPLHGCTCRVSPGVPDFEGDREGQTFSLETDTDCPQHGSEE